MSKNKVKIKGESNLYCFEETVTEQQPVARLTKHRDHFLFLKDRNRKTHSEDLLKVSSELLTKQE